MKVITLNNFLIFISSVAFANIFWILSFSSFFKDNLGIRISNIIFIIQLFSFFIPLLIIRFLGVKK